MQEIIKTTLLEYDKSTFLVDLVKHDNGHLFITIEQTVHAGSDKDISQVIKINPAIVQDLIEVLSIYQTSLPKVSKQDKTYFSAEKKQEIIKRYLKGVSLKDIALQFDMNESIITQILENNGIKIVSNEMTKPKHYRRRRR
jgi:hypothetical protein